MLCNPGLELTPAHDLVSHVLLTLATLQMWMPHGLCGCSLVASYASLASAASTSTLPSGPSSLAVSTSSCR
jgi:hypothetical protein